MSERHYADWCKAKLGLSKEFEEGFNKGYEYAKQTIKPEIVKEYRQPDGHTKGCRLNVGGSECTCRKLEYESLLAEKAR